MKAKTIETSSSSIKFLWTIVSYWVSWICPFVFQSYLFLDLYSNMLCWRELMLSLSFHLEDSICNSDFRYIWDDEKHTKLKYPLIIGFDDVTVKAQFTVLNLGLEILHVGHITGAGVIVARKGKFLSKFPTLHSLENLIIFNKLNFFIKHMKNTNNLFLRY